MNVLFVKRGTYVHNIIKLSVFTLLLLFTFET